MQVVKVVVRIGLIIIHFILQYKKNLNLLHHKFTLEKQIHLTYLVVNYLIKFIEN